MWLKPIIFQNVGLFLKTISCTSFFYGFYFFLQLNSQWGSYRPKMYRLWWKHTVLLGRFEIDWLSLHVFACKASICSASLCLASMFLLIQLDRPSLHHHLFRCPLVQLARQKFVIPLSCNIFLINSSGSGAPASDPNVGLSVTIAVILVVSLTSILTLVIILIIRGRYVR